MDYADILALNVRTEIWYGLRTDGCTALGWRIAPDAGTGTEGASYLVQNWDWREEQKENIIALHIEQPGKPDIWFMTEAGIIGKIGTLHI